MAWKPLWSALPSSVMIVDKVKESQQRGGEALSSFHLGNLLTMNMLIKADYTQLCMHVTGGSHSKRDFIIPLYMVRIPSGGNAEPEL